MFVYLKSFLSLFTVQPPQNGLVLKSAIKNIEEMVVHKNSEHESGRLNKIRHMFYFQ